MSEICVQPADNLPGTHPQEVVLLDLGESEKAIFNKVAVISSRYGFCDFAKVHHVYAVWMTR